MGMFDKAFVKQVLAATLAGVAVYYWTQRKPDSEGA